MSKDTQKQHIKELVREVRKLKEAARKAKQNRRAKR